jgi:hypothetical protein
MGSAMAADEFWQRRYMELRSRWNEVHAAAYAPSRIRTERDALLAENQQLREALREIARIWNSTEEDIDDVRLVFEAALAAVVEE